jgi:acyl carrier protein
MNDILAEIQKACAKVLCRTETEVPADKRLIEDLGADSMDLSDIVMRLEDCFGVDLYNDDRLNRAKTPADLAQLVRLKIGEPAQVNN